MQQNSFTFIDEESSNDKIFEDEKNSSNSFPDEEINDLPEWSIEPPVVISRNNDEL